MFTPKKPVISFTFKTLYCQRLQLFLVRKKQHHMVSSKLHILYFENNKFISQCFMSYTTCLHHPCPQPAKYLPPSARPRRQYVILFISEVLYTEATFKEEVCYTLQSSEIS